MAGMVGRLGAAPDAGIGCAEMDLEPGERTIYEGHPSWRSILSYYLKGLLVAVVAGAIAAGVTRIADDEVKWGWVVAVFAIVFGIIVLAGLIRRISTTYTITTVRLHIKRGIVARRVQQTSLDRVQNVNTDQSVIDRLLQVGTVDFDTAGTGDSDFKFRGVNEPEEVVAAIDLAKKQAATSLG
jgi:uncharacterized membrane protein YdbT with pleckstrin-like domain